MNNDIKYKTIADLGCGKGILGLGAAVLEAKKVYLIEKHKVIDIAKRNAKSLEIFNKLTFIEKDVKSVKIHADTVIQNPPFGTKEKHADKRFLEKAFSIADVIYSFHKIESKKFLEKISRDYNFTITHIYKFKLPIKATQKFHKRKIHRIDVGCWRLVKQLNI